MVDKEKQFSRTLIRISILLGILVLLVFMPAIVSLFRPNRQKGPILRSESHMVYLVADGARLLARDKDRDGTVDCMIPPGTSSITGKDSFRAQGFDGRCSRLGSPDTMSPEMREALTRMMTAKAELRASHTTCLDTDDDGAVDCVVSVHDPLTVAFRAPGASCPSDGGEELDEADVAAFSRILADERIVREELRRNAE